MQRVGYATVLEGSPSRKIAIPLIPTHHVRIADYGFCRIEPRTLLDIHEKNPIAFFQAAWVCLSTVVYADTMKRSGLPSQGCNALKRGSEPIQA